MSKDTNPIDLFASWLEEAQATGMREPTAMTLATADGEGFPSARIVLLKDFSEEGFTFYTNLGSQKVSEIQENPKVSLCFHWMSLKKQVRIAGIAEQVSDKIADHYFSSRPRQSQIGAWASKQSQPLEGTFELEKRVAYFATKFGVNQVPRPEFWSGFIVRPLKIEFWTDKPFRLHDRFVFKKINDQWESQQLFP